MEIPEPVELSHELIAEIDGVEPAYPIPESAGRLAAEALDFALHMLGLDEPPNDLHSLLWHGYEHSRLTVEQATLWAERAAETLAGWLRDHGVPYIHFWFPSRQAGDWAYFKLTAAKPEVYHD